MVTFEINGLRMRSKSELQHVLVDVFGIAYSDIESSDWRNDCVELEISKNNKVAQQRVMAVNGRKIKSMNSIITIRKLSGTNHDHLSRSNMANVAKYSDILYKVSKIPLHWIVDDIVKYFEVSCKAPLRSCYRLNQESEYTQSPLWAFVEFKSAESAKKARKILERNPNSKCLGMSPIPICDIAKILECEPVYLCKWDSNKSYRGHGRAKRRDYREKYHRDFNGHGHSVHMNGFGNKDINKKKRKVGTLNGYRLKKKIKEKDKRYKAKIKKKKKQKRQQREKEKKRKRHVCVSSSDGDGDDNNNADDSSMDGSSYSDSNDDSYSSSYSSVSASSRSNQNGNGTGTKTKAKLKAKKTKHRKLKKLRHITRSTKLKPKSIVMNGEMNDESESEKASTPTLITLKIPDVLCRNVDKLLIFGVDITAASKIKQITKKLEKCGQFIHATLYSDNEIISAWNNLICFFEQNPKHFTLHLDYVSSLILCLLNYHCYLIPLHSFLKLPIYCLLELCSSSNGLKIIETFLSFSYQRFHFAFQSLLISNIDIIVPHDAGCKLIKLAFSKLCKSSLYNIVKIIDEKNYKQLAKELIPIIQNRKNMPDIFKLNDDNIQNIILSSAASNNPKPKPLPPPPPPPPPRTPININKIASAQSVSSSSSNERKRRAMNQNGHNINYLAMHQPPKKRQKMITNEIITKKASMSNSRKKVVDPRLIRKAKPIKIVYKRANGCYEWNLNVQIVIRNVEDCLEKSLEQTSLKNVLGTDLLALCAELDGMKNEIIKNMQSLSLDSFKKKYKIEQYLLGYLNKEKEAKKYDFSFYFMLFEIMQIVFKVPESIYTVIDIKNTKCALSKLLSNVCKDEPVLFVDEDKSLFCVCSKNLGIVQIIDADNQDCNAFIKRFDALIAVDEHFKSLYAEWKKKGVTTQCMPKGNKTKWLNALVAYLYLVFDVCQIEKAQISNKYLRKLLNVETDAWNYSLPIRFLNFLFRAVKELDDRDNFKKIKAHFQKDISNAA